MLGFIHLILVGTSLVVFLLNFFKYSGSIISLLVVLVNAVLLLTGKQMDALYYVLMIFYSGISFLAGTSMTLLYKYIKKKK